MSGALQAEQAPRFARKGGLAYSLLCGLTLLVAGVAVLLYVRSTLRWRLAIDSPVMHYVVLLMRHGLHPYRDIGDSNMPGAYITEALAMRVFGDSDLSWRLYEFFLLAAMSAAMTFIAKSSHWVAGVFAAGVFIVLHGADGPQVAAERELVITALLMVGYAFLFAAERRHKPWLALGFGLAGGLACSIKPTYVLLPVAVLALCFIALRRQRRPALPFLLWAVSGLAIVLIAVLGFLLWHRALPAFLLTLRLVVPAYAGSGKTSFLSLLGRSLPRAVFLLLIVGLLLAGRDRFRRWAWQGWERWALAAGAAFGLLSFVVQGKGFVYHRYPAMAFVLLLVAIELFEAAREAGWPQLVAGATAAVVLLILIPTHLRALRDLPASGRFELALEQDLRQLGPPGELEGKVECLDMTYGCLNALYHLGVAGNTGFTGDMTLFSATENPVVRLSRQRFTELAKQDPAGVIVLSNQLFSEPNSFAKIDRWPAFSAYLEREYALLVERRFPNERFGVPFVEPFPGDVSDGYRVYVKRNSPLLTRGTTLRSPGEVAIR